MVLQLALWAGLAAAAGSGAILIAIVLLRVRLLLRKRRERKLTALWQPVLAQCVDRPTPNLPRVLRMDCYFILKLWNFHHELLRGQATQHLNDLLRRTHLDLEARRMLEHGSVRVRLLAIVTLGNLREHGLEGELRLLADDASPLISLAAARALLQCESKTILPWLMSRVASRQDWAITRVVAMLSELGPDSISEPLARALRSAAESPDATVQVPRVLKLLDLAHPFVVAPAVRDALGRARDADVLASCVRALADPHDGALARTYAVHPAWQVRVAAAFSLRRFAIPEDCELLVGMLSDPHWWVRHSAAETLIALPFLDLADLQKTQRTLGDPFAADMLGHAIAEQAA